MQANNNICYQNSQYTWARCLSQSTILFNHFMFHANYYVEKEPCTLSVIAADHLTYPLTSACLQLAYCWQCQKGRFSPFAGLQQLIARFFHRYYFCRSVENDSDVYQFRVMLWTQMHDTVFSLIAPENDQRAVSVKSVLLSAVKSVIRISLHVSVTLLK